MSRDIKISVIVLNWNGEKIINEYLPYWKKTCCESYSQLVIVDNGSNDKSVEILRKDTDDIKKIFLDQNYGFAKGYNIAVSMMDTDYVVLLNSDVEPTEGWLEKPLELLEQNDNISAIQPKIKSRRNRDFFEYAGAAGGFIDKYGYPFCRGRIFDTLEKDLGQYDNQIDIFWASGAALFIRKKDYIEAGGLDESFFAHQEEIDLCWRLRNLGKRVVFSPESVVYHYGGATLDMKNPKKTYLNFRNNLLMIYKNISENKMFLVFSLRFLLDLCSCIMFVLKLELKNSLSVLRGMRDFFKLKKDFAPKRRKIQSLSANKEITEMKNYSIVFNYFIKNKKKYSDIE